jgi:hypothetical protein
MPFLLPATLCLSALFAAPPSSPGPTLAHEDTMRTAVSEVLVRAPRITLNEILDRVAHGESRRDSAIVDQSFTATFRIVRDVKGDHPEMVAETVARVYRKRPNRVRTVVLRQWESAKKKRARVDINFRPDMSEQIVNFAFRPSARLEYRYRIEGRDLAGNHLIYRIAFEPRSTLDPSLPSGLVWVDTNDFVIVRQEVKYGRSPVPLFIKDVDRMVIEREKINGHWLLRRVLLRAGSSLPLFPLGRSFDISLLLDQYAVNSGLDDALFDAR